MKPFTTQPTNSYLVYKLSLEPYPFTVPLARPQSSQPRLPPRPHLDASPWRRSRSSLGRFGARQRRDACTSPSHPGAPRPCCTSLYSFPRKFATAVRGQAMDPAADDSTQAFPPSLMRLSTSSALPAVRQAAACLGLHGFGFVCVRLTVEVHDSCTELACPV
jgi:hypothetical protein